MLNFFDTIVEYIQIIWSFFLNLVTGLFSAVTTLVTGVSNAVLLSAYVPWFITSSFLISIFIVVVNYLIGRDNR